MRFQSETSVFEFFVRSVDRVFEKTCKHDFHEESFYLPKNAKSHHELMIKTI